MRRVEGAPPGRPALVFALRALGLVAVAVVAGLVWWLIRHDPGTDTEKTAQQTTGEFRFDAAHQPVSATDCAGNSYGKIKEWFAEHPCRKVVRGLYVTTPGQNVRALVSVVVVTMDSPETAQQLKAITDTDDTGNVNDLVKDGTAKLPGAPRVATGEYTSKAAGADVTIVEAQFFDEHKDNALLMRVAADALRLADQLRSAA
ncbi:hypothetical protein EWH70_32070 [Amycolatopsis suaedae]|uniref:Uncharacterized protein n=1 Tax=Amycolatopsis suaedae TaxID=2510978 RepID=A0A4Q7J029_9PSEU|nr:hypothetical protein EWH70_32070 [Amycolatopsis suaedae]